MDYEIEVQQKAARVTAWWDEGEECFYIGMGDDDALTDLIRLNDKKAAHTLAEALLTMIGDLDA